MKALKYLLIAQTFGIIIFTVLAVLDGGPNFLAVFADNLLELSWTSQFNLDFACYLVLSGFWISWRHNFSTRGIVAGLAASILGILFFGPYLLVQTKKAEGNIRTLLTGSPIDETQKD